MSGSTAHFPLLRNSLNGNRRTAYPRVDNGRRQPHHSTRGAEAADHMSAATPAEASPPGRWTANGESHHQTDPRPEEAGVSELHRTQPAAGDRVEGRPPAARESGGNDNGLVVEPWDAYNQELVRNVHPPDWTHPVPKARYHLVVVGGGTGGLVSAAIAAGLGARVALVERGLLGGDCLNTGCVPSKALLRAGRSWSEAATSEARFGGPRADGRGDFSAVMRRMRRIRAEISSIDRAARYRDLGADVFLGEGQFTSPRTLAVGDVALRFRRAIIATGSRPTTPPIPGLAEAGVLTNETVFSLTELPDRLVVIGAGPIGCELAQAFARFGSRVVLLDVADRVLPREESDAASVVQAALERDGVEFVGGAKVTRVERRGEERVVVYENGATLCEAAGTEVLVAVGRTPNVDGLGLEAAGVGYERGGIKVDRRLRTTNPRIYAVGDVASKYPFTHAADAQARVAVRNALFFGRASATDLVIPWCTYTSPELARVGFSAAEARSDGISIDTVTVPFQEVDRARVDGETEGFIRVHLRKGTDSIAGATIVGEHAGELISQLAHTMKAGTGLETLGDVVFPYPTRAEALRKAADRRRREKLTPRVQRAFALFFRVFR